MADIKKIGINRKRLDIEIGGETFPISFVSIFVRKKTAELFEGIGNLSGILKSELPEDEKAEKLEDIIQSREIAIQAVLEGNGLEYEPEWWEKNTDYADQNEFLRVCITKDIIQDKKKEESKASEK